MLVKGRGGGASTQRWSAESDVTGGRSELRHLGKVRKGGEGDGEGEKKEAVG